MKILFNKPDLTGVLIFTKKRIDFALDNTCEKQIERIEKIISENV